MPSAPRYFSSNEAIFGTSDLEARIRNNSLHTVGLAEATITGQAPDGGLLMPTYIPKFPLSKIMKMGNMEYWQVFTEVTEPFFDGVLSRKTREKIAQEAYNFEPLIQWVSENTVFTRLDLGPSGAFKDFRGQVFFRIIDAIINDEPLTEIEFRRSLKDVDLFSIINSTSGDTGSAMGKGCLKMPKMWMAILHSAYIPEHVRELQAKQMDILGYNIEVMRILTDYTGCAKLASRLERDPELGYMRMISANSANIGNILPQMVYYFWIYPRISKNGGEIYFSIPSGNFGNATAGLFAKMAGLPIKIIASVNENDVVYRLYKTGKYEPEEGTHPSPSNSMNVKDPSNIRRFVQPFGGQIIDSVLKVQPNMEMFRSEIFVERVSDAETKEYLLKHWREGHKIGELHSTIEDHGTVGYGGAEKCRQRTGYNGIIGILETGEPGKFCETLNALGIYPELRPDFAKLVKMPHGNYLILPNDYETVKSAVKYLYNKQLESQRKSRSN